MFKSSLCRVLSVVCVLLHCSALDVDKQQNGQTKRQCLRNCFCQTTVQMNGTQLKSKITSRQSCYEQCLQKNGKHDIIGNQQTKPLFKRTKRDASSLQANSKQYDESNGFCNYKGDENLRGLAHKYVVVKFYNNTSTGRMYANISWNPPSETANWTGYRIIYTYNWEYFNCADVEKNVTSINVSYGWNYGDLVRFQIVSLPQMKVVDGHRFKGYFALTKEGHGTTSPSPQGHGTTSPSPLYSAKIIDETDYRVTSSIADEQTNPFSIPDQQKTTSPSPHSEQTNPPSITDKLTLLAIPTAFVAISIAVAVVYCLFRRPKRKTLSQFDTEVLTEVIFDAYIIYSSEDQEWVNDTLLPTLEKKHGLKCCIHYRDFIPGRPFRENMVDSVYNSRKTVAVVSRSFLKSRYCNYEMNMALGRLLERRDNSVVVIKLDDVDRKNLPKALKERSYIDYPKSIEKETWEKKLVDCLKAPVKDKFGNTYV